MYRVIILDEEMVELFDLLSMGKDLLKGLSGLNRSIMGSTTPWLHGFSASQTTVPSMTINLADGYIYQWHAVDDSPYASLPADSTEIMQMGYHAAQQKTFSISDLSAGQSKWALVRARFVQSDAIREGDPMQGQRSFYNAANPTAAFRGVNDDGQPINTVREAVAEISVVYGAPATTGQEVPPECGADYVPLYLINLTFGQDTITTGQIQVAGSAVYPGYTEAPFWYGIRAQHHKGLSYGQAPPIVLTQEVSGILPLGNCPSVDTYTGSALPTVRAGTGDPNGSVAGAVGSQWIQTDAGIAWFCVVAGNASTAVWNPGGAIGLTILNITPSAPATVTAAIGAFAIKVTTGDSIVNLPSAVNPRTLEFRRGDVPGYKATLTPTGSQKIWYEDQELSSLALLTGNSIKLVSSPTESRWYAFG